MDLRHERRVDEPGTVVDLAVGPGRVLGPQTVADRVVLERKEGVEEPKAQPEVASDARKIDEFVEIFR